MAKLDRLLNLTAALLDTTVPLTADQIQDRVPDYPEGQVAFHRAFERDKDDLRVLGIPLETVTVTHLEQPKSAYTIDQETYALPDPGLTPEELASLHLASTSALLEGYESEDLDFAFRKLGGSTAAAAGMAASSDEGSSGDGSSGRSSGGRSSSGGASDTGAAGPLVTIPVTPALTTLFQATTERREVEFDYLGTKRRLKPYRLQFERGHWYLSGHDLDRNDQRSFRLDRISGDVTTGAPRSFERPAAPRGVSTRPWELGEGPAVPVRVLIDREPARATLIDYPELTVVETSSDGAVVVELAVTNRPGLWTFMVNLLDRAEILGPPDVRDGLVEYLRTFAEDGTRHD